jgi:hypothetical protein
MVAKRHYETDGLITPHQIWRHEPETAEEEHGTFVKELVSVGLLDEVSGGLQVSGWLERNPSAAYIEETRAGKRRAGRAGGLKSAEVRGSRTKPGASVMAKQNEAIDIVDSDSTKFIVHSSQPLTQSVAESHLDSNSDLESKTDKSSVICDDEF